MNPLPDRASQQGPVPQPLENDGFLYGALAGVLLGVLISGPHFADWPLWKILGVSGVCALTAGVICHLAIAATRVKRGTGPEVFETPDFSLLDQDGEVGDN